jgi:hypothetical protein
MSEAEVKVTMNPTPAPTPADEVIARAKGEIVVFDDKGRAIKIKKPGILAQYRLIEVLGKTAANTTYMDMVMPLIYVAEIDGEVVFQPATKGEVEALIQRLDEDGVNTVMAAVYANFGKQNAETDKAAIKN